MTTLTVSIVTILDVKVGDERSALRYWYCLLLSITKGSCHDASHAGAGGRCTIVVDSTSAEASGLIHGVHSGHAGLRWMASDS